MRWAFHKLLVDTVHAVAAHQVLQTLMSCMGADVTQSVLGGGGRANLPIVSKDEVRRPARYSLLEQISGNVGWRGASAAALPFVWLDLVEMELLQQHRESETEILDLRATIEQGFGREGGGLPMVCSLPISTKFRLHGLSIEEHVKNGTKTLRGRACEAVTTGMGGYYLTWETDVLSTSSRQGLYIGNDKSKARDALLHHLITTGTTEVDALRPLMLHASGEKGPARFIGRMLQPAQLMLSKFAWSILSPQEQATHWLGSLVSRRRNGKVVYEPVWTVYPYLILDACANWDLNVSHFNGPDKFAKLVAPGSVWYLGVDSVCHLGSLPRL